MHISELFRGSSPPCFLCYVCHPYIARRACTARVTVLDLCVCVCVVCVRYSIISHLAQLRLKCDMPMASASQIKKVKLFRCKRWAFLLTAEKFPIVFFQCTILYACVYFFICNAYCNIRVHLLKPHDVYTFYTHRAPAFKMQHMYT